MIDTPNGTPECPILLPPKIKPPVRREPFITHDYRGDPAVKRYIANVPLPCGRMARLLLEDFNRLMDLGWSNQFHLHSNGRNHAYVRVSRADMPGRIATVARLITGGQSRTQVRYADRDPTNLLPENLTVGGGYSKGREAEALFQAHATF